MKVSKKSRTTPPVAQNDNAATSNVVPIRKPRQPLTLGSYHLLSAAILKSARNSKSKALRRLYDDAMADLREIASSPDKELALAAITAIQVAHSHKGVI